MASWGGVGIATGISVVVDRTAGEGVIIGVGDMVGIAKGVCVVTTDVKVDGMRLTAMVLAAGKFSSGEVAVGAETVHPARMRSQLNIDSFTICKN